MATIQYFLIPDQTKPILNEFSLKPELLEMHNLTSEIMQYILSVDFKKCQKFLLKIAIHKGIKITL